MKMLFILTISFISIMSHANTVESVFKKDTNLPKVLQEKIFMEIVHKIPGLAPFSVYEMTTEVRVDRIDQGIRDYYYKTKFRILTTFDDHRTRGYIFVESAEYSFYCQNDCNFEIQSLKTQILENE